MNTHDKIDLPPHDVTANLDGALPIRLYSEAKVRAAIEADRQQQNSDTWRTRYLKLHADYKEALKKIDLQSRGEPVAWHTEDHLTDKSATTYDPVVAKRWLEKGWPVSPLFQAPQPTNPVVKDSLTVAEPVPLTTMQRQMIRNVIHEAGQRSRCKGDYHDQVADLLSTIAADPQTAEPGKVPTNEDAKFLDWLSTNLFERKWGGTIGNPCEWHLRGDWRHTLQRMKGPDIRAAITQAMQQERQP